MGFNSRANFLKVLIDCNQRIIFAFCDAPILKTNAKCIKLWFPWPFSLMYYLDKGNLGNVNCDIPSINNDRFVISHSYSHASIRSFVCLSVNVIDFCSTKISDNSTDFREFGTLDLGIKDQTHHEIFQTSRAVCAYPMQL